ncbi:hypothetical protein VM98_17575 [Streptomyces rubellomurinus subsp. indigoferus]|nr:hypothetical protein VM98_17575 [Streptomyces rubellomurinus subsp. indigoferus]
MASADVPLLFLDVDGPLIPFGGPPPGGHRTYPGPGSGPDGNPLLARVDPALGPRLLGLPCTLVWATTWLEDANDCLSPRLSLPRLPVVDWPVADEDGPEHPGDPHGLHWKTRPLLAWAGGRPFVWVDDEITPADRRWVDAHSPARALLHRVDPQRGLGEADFTAIETWLHAA